MAKQKKIRLRLDDFDDDLNVEIIGICSPVQDFRLAWFVNNTLGINLYRKEKDFKKTIKKKECQFPWFECFDEDTKTYFFLIKNKVQGEMLIPSKPLIDYFLFLYENTILDIIEIRNKLRGVDLIVGAYEFEAEEIPEMEILEIH